MILSNIEMQSDASEALPRQFDEAIAKPLAYGRAPTVRLTICPA